MTWAAHCLHWGDHGGEKCCNCDQRFPDITTAWDSECQALCGLRFKGNECHRPEGHSGSCYDERTRVAFEDGWWADDRGNESAPARTPSGGTT